MKIIKNFLPEDEYYSDQHDKTLIVLHHTVSRNNPYYAWTYDKRNRNTFCVGTAYSISPLGEIYQHFPDKCWAWHIGRGIRALEQRSIGIELWNYGALRKIGDTLYTDYVYDYRNKKVRDNKWKYRFVGNHVELEKSYRGYKYFEEYSDQQIGATIELVNRLLERHSEIPRDIPNEIWKVNKYWRTYTGVVSHTSLRADKSDVHPGFPVEKLIKKCKLRKDS